MPRMPVRMAPATRAINFGGFGVASLLLLCSHLFGKQGLSTLRGTVTDKSGAVVAGVAVSAREVSTNITQRAVTTDAQGNYEMPGLKAATYQVTASISGFKTSVVDEVLLQSNLTKSGTNEYHGEASYYHRNSALGARNFFEDQKTKVLYHTFNTSASGPIIKNKTFFYGLWNGERVPGQAFYLQSAPTPNMRSGDFSELLTSS